ncbi:MAG: hypothetical protein MHMPM18_000156 [Marteilia pararefringens]
MTPVLSHRNHPIDLSLKMMQQDTGNQSLQPKIVESLGETVLGKTCHFCERPGDNEKYQRCLKCEKFICKQHAESFSLTCGNLNVSFR